MSRFGPFGSLVGSTVRQILGSHIVDPKQKLQSPHWLQAEQSARQSVQGGEEQELPPPAASGAASSPCCKRKSVRSDEVLRVQLTVTSSVSKLPL